MREVITRSLAASALLLVLQLTVFGQTTGSISGTVTDPNGAIIAGASVTAKHNATGIEHTAIAKDDGVFILTALRPGNYSVTVEAAGFKRTVAPDIVVEVSQQAQVTIRLEVGLATETVTVTAAQEVINSSSPTLTRVINTRQIEDLPVSARNPLDLAALQAGIAVIGTDTRGGSVGGLRGSATNVTQDGINAMDNFVKTSSFFALNSPSLNAISEFSITTGTVGSDAGRGVAQVNSVTRGGSNDFHGGIFYLTRNDALNANTFFNNLAGTERQRQRQHFFGFDIGGPVYFLNFGDGGGPSVWSERTGLSFSSHMRAFAKISPRHEPHGAYTRSSPRYIPLYRNKWPASNGQFAYYRKRRYVESYYAGVYSFNAGAEQHPGWRRIQHGRI